MTKEYDTKEKSVLFLTLYFDIQHQQKISPRYTMQNGINHQHLGFDLMLDVCPAIAKPLERVYDSDGNTGLTRFYTSHKLMLTNRLSAVGGVNVMWFNLNDQWLVEPRFSIAYKTSATSTLSLAYALNSRRENTDVYFVETKEPTADGSGHTVSNKDLGLTRSHHVSLSFAKQLGEDAQIKVEPYYQYVFNVPVEMGSTFSLINNRQFYVDRHLVNEGACRNYGIDFTVKYTINKQHVAHHFILEYLKIKTFQGRTIDLKTNEIVDQFSALTFPNIGYRVEV